MNPEKLRRVLYGDGYDVLSSMIQISALENNPNIPVAHSFNKIVLSLKERKNKIEGHEQHDFFHHFQTRLFIYNITLTFIHGNINFHYISK